MSPHARTIKKNSARDLRLVTVGQGVSLVGDAITTLALPIVAVDLLNADSLGTGLLGAASTVAYLVIGLQAGVWIDRSSRRAFLIAADAARVLLTSAVTLTRAVLPGMRARRWGRILTITSIAARQPVDGLMLSNSLRAAVMAFARTLANETAADGVTVNNLMPGYTKTDRVIDLSTQVAARDGVAVSDVYARWEREIPMRRLGEPREFGALAAFLASDLASYITGQSIAVDGGWIKGL